MSCIVQADGDFLGGDLLGAQFSALNFTHVHNPAELGCALGENTLSQGKSHNVAEGQFSIVLEVPNLPTWNGANL